MPAVNSKPLDGRKQKNVCMAHGKSGCEYCGSSVLAELVKAGEAVGVVGEVATVITRRS